MADRSGTRVRNVLIRLLAVVIMFVLTVGVVELLFRVIGYDFNQQEAALAHMPIYCRQPRVPVGDVYYRRPDPQDWHAQVLNVGHERSDGIDMVYDDELLVDIHYDKQGFRNHDDLTDWEIAVVGDSCVEAGYLEHRDLFTSALGRHLNVRVKNLGLSFNGPRAYICYTKYFGLAKSTRHIVMVFFEGNDITDLEREQRDIDTFERTGKRPVRDIDTQSSVFKTLRRYAGDLINPPVRPRRKFQNAWFASTARDIGVSVGAPAHMVSDKLTPPTVDALKSCLAEWSRMARDHGATAWLAYMPSKRRALAPGLRFTDNANPDSINWKPGDILQFLETLCEKHDVRFVDLTPALIAQS
jgi:hypothetical protein